MSNRGRGRLSAVKGKTKFLGIQHWVFCEGATEKRVLDDLAGHWRLANVQIEALASQGDPSAILKKAKAKATELKRDKAKYKIHVVFDRDIHCHFNGAVNDARKADFVVGVSVPCFELWAILMHQDQTAHIERHPAQSLLKQLSSGYHHKNNPYLKRDEVLRYWSVAADRAAKLRKYHQGHGNNLFPNPITYFDEVLHELRKKS